MKKYIWLSAAALFAFLPAAFLEITVEIRGRRVETGKRFADLIHLLGVFLSGDRHDR